VAFSPPFGSFKLSFLNIGQGLFLFKTLCSNTSTIILAQSAFYKKLCFFFGNTVA
jgi:hypothetical protein